MRVHELKLDTQFFDDVKSGKKNFDIRENNQEYCVGDIVILFASGRCCHYCDGTSYKRYYNGNCSGWMNVYKHEADTIKVKITGLWTLETMFTEDGYVNDIEDSIDLDMYENNLDDVFKTDSLPLGYVVMATEVYHENI